jgi:hypothetical protein
MRTKLLYIIYPLVLLSLFPIIQYEVVKRSIEYDEASKFWILFRVVFSGPILLLSGLVLAIAYRKWQHKVIGIICTGISCYWIYMVIVALAAEQSS